LGDRLGPDPLEEGAGRAGEDNRVFSKPIDQDK